MSIAAARNVMHVRGALCINPTDLSADFPHGGTALGLVRDHVFRPNIRTYEVTAEEWGGQSVEWVTQGESATFAAVLREYDTDALTLCFPNAASSARSGKAVISRSVSGGIEPGSLVSDRAVVLCFSPKAIETQPMLLMYRALPMVDERTRLQLSVQRELGFAVMFQGTPDEQERVWRMGLRSDPEMTL